MHRLIATVTVLALPAALQAQATPATPLSGLSFLVGEWRAGQGQVADTGGTATGRSTFTLEAGGNVLLRRDHTDLLDKAGRPAGGFDQIMMIYPEAGTLHAEYSDGQHVIHYGRAEVVPGRSITFTSAPRPDAPTFRLRYILTAPRSLGVAFETAAPGSAEFHPIATGTLTRPG